MEIASLVLSVIAVLVAGASTLYTRRQAAEAGKATAIEQRRFHADQTPEIALKCDARDAEGNQAELMLELTGPAALDRLDQVTVRIRDDQPAGPHRARCRLRNIGTRSSGVRTGSSQACGTPIRMAGRTGRSRCRRTSLTSLLGRIIRRCRPRPEAARLQRQGGAHREDPRGRQPRALPGVRVRADCPQDQQAGNGRSHSGRTGCQAPGS
jgi:hypothetical protein